MYGKGKGKQMIGIVKNNRVLFGLITFVFLLSTAAMIFDLEIKLGNIFNFSRENFGINLPVFLAMIALATITDRNLNKRRRK
jgi:hypothetical protein